MKGLPDGALTRAQVRAVREHISARLDQLEVLGRRPSPRSIAIAIVRHNRAVLGGGPSRRTGPSGARAKKWEPSPEDQRRIWWLQQTLFRYSVLRQDDGENEDGEARGTARQPAAMKWSTFERLCLVLDGHPIGEGLRAAVSAARLGRKPKDVVPWRTTEPFESATPAELQRALGDQAIVPASVRTSLKAFARDALKARFPRSMVTHLLKRLVAPLLGHARTGGALASPEELGEARVRAAVLASVKAERYWLGLGTPLASKVAVRCNDRWNRDARRAPRRRAVSARASASGPGRQRG